MSNFIWQLKRRFLNKCKWCEKPIFVAIDERYSTEVFCEKCKEYYH